MFGHCAFDAGFDNFSGTDYLTVKEKQTSSKKKYEVYEVRLENQKYKERLLIFCVSFIP